MRDGATLGDLLGSLTVDVPSVVIASALGAAAGSAVVGSSVAGFAAIGALACGPFLVALVVGIAVGFILFEIDSELGSSEKLSVAYDDGLTKLARAWHELGDSAEQRYRQIESSRTVQDLSRDATQIAAKLGQEGDWVRWRLTHL